jgi:tetratricopeptide (TPR) repeat protein
MTDDLAQRVSSSENFRFLAEPALLLAGDAVAAEAYADSDPDAAMAKARRFSETLTKMVMRRAGLNPRDYRSHYSRIQALAQAAVIPDDVRQLLDGIRDSGNQAVHEYSGDRAVALSAVKACFDLGTWWYQTETGQDVGRTFSAPDPTEAASLRKLIKNVEDQVTRLQQAFESSMGEDPRHASSARTAKDVLEVRVPLRESNLPSRAACFTGRDQPMEQLGSLLDNGPVCVVALQGMGGVGKTQLVLEYAHRQFASGKYGIVWWVRAEHRMAMNEDLLALAPRLGLEGNADAEAVLAELSRRSNWLLVYDNVTDPELIAGRLPSSGHVILTSRSRGWSRYARSLDIGLFIPSESVTFLRARTGRDEPEAAELAEELGHLPLALAQAASYCEEHQLSIAGYLELFRSPRVKARLLEAGLHSAEYPDSVATTWLLHFDHLRTDHPSALQLLRLCAFLQPDAIALNMILSRFELLPGPLASAANCLDDELTGIVEQVSGVSLETKEDVVGELVNSGLITRLGDQLVSVHRLVQAVTRQEMGAERSAAWRCYVDLLVHALHPYPPFPAAAEYEDALGWLRINGAHLAEQLRDGVPPDKPLDVRRFSALTFTSGGEFITDFEYAFECRQRLTQALHQDMPLHAALTLSNLGYVRYLAGRHSEALEAMESAAKVITRKLPSFELDGLRDAITACRSASRRRQHSKQSDAGTSDTGTVAIIREHVDLLWVRRLLNSAGEKIVWTIVYPISENEIGDNFAAALEHEINEHLPFPFSPLWCDPQAVPLRFTQ